jgi:glycosyltransferase involved in cell wall biosynthesis
VTRLVERKGVQHILKALAELRKGSFKIKNISLLIVGTGNYEYQLKTLCKKLYLNDVVSFYGFCPRSKLPELYGQSNIFILPSLAESFGVVFAEAMACALPIISTKAGAIPDLVKDKHGILVEPGNVNELKEAIKYMLINKERWHAMGSASRDIICKKYSWKAVAQRYSYIYSINIVSSTFENKLADQRVPMTSRAA